MCAHDETARKGVPDAIQGYVPSPGSRRCFVVGARAGRERYEQMVKASRKVAENPTVQKATSAAGAKATAS